MFSDQTRKFSSFPHTSSLGSGSFAHGLTDTGSGSFQHVLLTPADLCNSRWRNAPEHYNSPGEDGWEAKDANYYYLYTDGAWKRVSLNSSF